MVGHLCARTELRMASHSGIETAPFRMVNGPRNLRAYLETPPRPATTLASPLARSAVIGSILPLGWQSRSQGRGICLSSLTGGPLYTNGRPGAQGGDESVNVRRRTTNPDSPFSVQRNAQSRPGSPPCRPAASPVARTTVVETLTRLLGIGATSANFSVVPRRPDKAVTVAQAQDDVRRVSAKLEAELLADIFARDRE